MPSRRNGWSESASRGRLYPVSFLIGVRFSLAVTMLFVYSELHWHKTAEVRVQCAAIQGLIESNNLISS